MAGLSDLPLDLFHVIILFLVNSPDGAQNFARAMAICRAFRDSAKVQKVQEALSFHNVSITNRCRTFHLGNDLLFKCAEAGNLSAQHLLSKVLLVSCSQLYIRERSYPSDVLHSPDPTQTENQNDDDDAFLAAWFVYRVEHEEAGRSRSELVRNFLRRCTPTEMIELGEHLSDYVRYFTMEETSHHTLFFRRVEGMVVFGEDIVGGATVNLLEIRKLIYVKYNFLMELWESRKKTRGASSSYSLADELMKEIDSLQTKMESMFELRLLCEGSGSYEKNPVLYFEKCRLEALEAFEFVV